ncbi:MAG TPA: ribosome-associated translation inhibitor RaiA [Actinomycetota bacterium]|nr:ribosome-associated translation inhibitor RaiA [Actinomycetota bacterium]
MSDVAEIVVHGRHVDVSRRFRTHVHSKLERIDKFGIPLRRVDVEVSKEANPRLADRAFEVELTTRAKGAVIRAEAAASDMYAALDIAYGRLEQRLRRAAGKTRLQRRGTESVRTARAPGLQNLETPTGDVTTVADELEEDTVWEQGPVVVREKSHATVPMSVEAAVTAMEMVGHDFFLFIDEKTGDPAVVYRRRGFDYGLIRVHEADQTERTEQSI